MSTAPAQPAPPPPRSSGTMSGGRIVLISVGCLLVLIGLGVAAAGGALLWAHQTQRDADGYFTTSTQPFRTGAYALVSDEIDLGAEGDAGWGSDVGNLARVRVRATAPGQRAVFVGIGPRRDVTAYLAGVPHSLVADVEYNPFRVDYEPRTGTRTPAPPGAQTFWSARAEGAGTQTITWQPRSGEWAVVVMNADGSRPVEAGVALGLKVGILLPLAIGLLVGGLVLLGSGATMLVFGIRGRRGSTGPDADAPGPPTPPAQGTSQ